MPRLLRTVGFGLMLVGAVLVLVWAIAPLLAIWPLVMSLSLPIRLGLLAAGLGLAVLLASLVTERIGEREADRKLLDDF